MNKNPFDFIFLDPAKFRFQKYVVDDFSKCTFVEVELEVATDFFEEIKDFMMEYARNRGDIMLPIYNLAYERFDKFLRGKLKSFGWERKKDSVEINLIVLRDSVR